MSAKSALESAAPESEQPQRDEHVVGRLRDLTGLMVSDRDLLARLPISIATFYRFKRQGRYDFLLAHPQPSNVTSYCGTLVQRWLDGAGGPGLARAVKRGANAR